ncbi:MAG: hypothetical protein GYA62_09190, partial [Bacteroidales bacterium]|nr:hypothetical protein [Bacteroidales bacterium]
IHPGKLPDNRGRHPISWSFLTNCKKFGLSIHEINEEIDRGNLLAQTTITRDLLDTQLEVEKKIEIELEKGLIKKAITNYFKGKKSEIGLGKYYESLVGKYKNLNIEEFDSKFVFNLFKSQFKYGGVIIKNKTYTECVFYNPNFINFYKNYDIYSCLDGEKVGLK